MESPCQRTIAAQRLAAHVPGKKNCYREAHIDHRYDVWGGGGLIYHHCDAMKGEAPYVHVVSIRVLYLRFHN